MAEQDRLKSMEHKLIELRKAVEYAERKFEQRAKQPSHFSEVIRC